jgi:striatin 1/3/4
MNPLPNRPLINNSSIPLSLPNVPPFDPIAYNGRPRKVLPESGSLINGINLMSGPSSAPAASGNQMQPLERSNPLLQHQVQQQQQQQQPPPPLSQPSTSQNPQISQLQPAPADSDKEDSESRQLTAIFRPDDAGEWREKLRLSHEASVAAASGPWDRRKEFEEDVKDEENEVDDDDSTVDGEVEGSKVWKPKRTLRKSVA